ncbi:MAG TPA: lysylphosphatidylglycerol synthase domain-containing protein, partial [Bryobacteraceae bacterium]
PVAAVGGDLLRGYLHERTGVPGPLAIGAIVVDLTTEVTAQLAFAGFALVLLLLAGHDDGTALPLLVGLLILILLVVGFYLAQRRELFSRAIKIFEGVLGIQAPAGSAYAQSLDRMIRELYRSQSRVRASVLFHLLAWLSGALQMYAAAMFLGRPIGWQDALILEGLVTAVRAAAFMIPGGLGVQEGGFILVGGLIGLSPEVALALALIRRVRELVLGIAGIIAWQWRTIAQVAAR